MCPDGIHELSSWRGTFGLTFITTVTGSVVQKVSSRLINVPRRTLHSDNNYCDLGKLRTEEKKRFAWGLFFVVYNNITNLNSTIVFVVEHCRLNPLQRLYKTPYTIFCACLLINFCTVEERVFSAEENSTSWRGGFSKKCVLYYFISFQICGV